MVSQEITLQLTRGHVAVIDREDAHLASFKWYAIEGRSGIVYAVRSIRHPDGRITREWLHRRVYENMIGRPLERDELVDHEDRDGRNCRRGNLRLANYTQNGANRRVSKSSASGLKGAYKNKSGWASAIKSNGKTTYLGWFPTKEQAHEAYCEAAKTYHGEFYNDGTSEGRK